jgi:hypothetical protein
MIIMISAGTYQVTISVDESTNYLGTSTTATLKINQAQSVITVSDKTVTYDGHAHSITATLNHDQADLEYIGNGQTQAGEHTITISVPESTNYLGASTTAKLTINKAQATIDAENLTVTYNKAAHSISGTLSHSEATLTYTYESTSSSDPIEFTNAGTYVITISAPATTNYLAVTKEVTLKINKAQATITATDKTVTYNKAAHSIAGTLNHDETTVKYQAAGVAQQSTPIEFTNAGTYVITISAIETANYLSVSKNVTLTIS